MTKQEDEARVNEAKGLAADAMEAAKRGNKAEAEFLMQEACEMDEAAAAEVAERVRPRKAPQITD